MADLVEEILEELLAARRVRDLGMELHAVERAGLVARGGVRAGGRGRQRDEVRRQLVHLIAVAHPDGGFLGKTAHERVICGDAKPRAAIFARFGGLDLTAQDLRADLHAVTDPQDRHAQLEDLGIAAGCARFVHAARSAGEDQPSGIELAQFVKRDVRANELAEDALLADAAGDELGVLRPEIEDRNDFVVDHSQ